MDLKSQKPLWMNANGAATTRVRSRLAHISFETQGTLCTHVGVEMPVMTGYDLSANRTSMRSGRRGPCIAILAWGLRRWPDVETHQGEIEEVYKVNHRPWHPERETVLLSIAW